MTQKSIKRIQYNEHTPGLCITRMHTANPTYTRKNTPATSKVLRPKAMLRRGKKKKKPQSDQMSDRQTITETISAPTIDATWITRIFNSNAFRKEATLKRRRRRI